MQSSMVSVSKKKDRWKSGTVPLREISGPPLEPWCVCFSGGGDGDVPCGGVRGYEPVCDPCESCDDHAEGHGVSSKDQDGDGVDGQ